MAFPPAFLDELVARNPIEEVVGQYVSLKRTGSNLFGLCPFHGEKSASFSVSPTKRIYRCFGCGKGGGVINFMMEIENLSYPDAVRALAKRAGMEVPEDERYKSRYRQQERLWALTREAARFYVSQLYAPAGAEGLAYAQKRGMTKSILTKFGIGFAPNSWSALIDAMKAKGYTIEELKAAQLVSVSPKNGRVYDRFRNRLMFPIIDVRGNVIGFGGRVMDDSKPKYLNSPESIIFNKSRNLFGMNFARSSKLDYLILVEGYMDAIALYQYGFDCAVASLGTSLTEEQAVLISRHKDNVVLIYDGDGAGQNAAKRAIPMLEKVGLKVRVLQLKDAKDPDEYLKKFGPDKFRILLEDSANGIEYQLSAIARKYDVREDDQRVEFIHEAASFISTLSSAVQREVYGHRVADAAKISYEAMKMEVNKAYKRRTNKEKKQQEKQNLSPVQNLQPRARTIRYDNMKSARAEETVLAMVLKEPAMLDDIRDLAPEEFSSPLLGNVYSQLRGRHEQGLVPGIDVLEDLSSDEMSHITGIFDRQEGPVNERALRDCVQIIKAEHGVTNISSEDDLLALRNRYKERKGIRE